MQGSWSSDDLLYLPKNNHLVVIMHQPNEPLAERMRPKTLEDYISQKHLVGEKGVLKQIIEI